MGGWGILRNGGDLRNDGDDFEMGGIDTPLQTISYTSDHMFEEIALQVSRGNSSLNFPYSEQHLLILARSHPPTGQIKSPR